MKNLPALIVLLQEGRFSGGKRPLGKVDFYYVYQGSNANPKGPAVRNLQNPKA